MYLPAIMELCLDKEKNLIADTPEKKAFSQQTNLLAIVSDIYPQEKQGEIMDIILSDTSLTQATISFHYYLFKALHKTNHGDRFAGLLKPWHKILEYGLTTFPETNIEDEPRSDCHVWSPSPMWAFLSVVAGIQSVAPGFSEIVIKPQPGNYDFIWNEKNNS